MSSMFYGCKTLLILNVSNFNTSNVTNMGSMFGDCDSLISLDLSSFDTCNVTNIKSMFVSCDKLETLDFSNINLSSLTENQSYFYKTENIKNVILKNVSVENYDNSYFQYFLNSFYNNTTLYLKDSDCVNKMTSLKTNGIIYRNFTLTDCSNADNICEFNKIIEIQEE